MRGLLAWLQRRAERKCAKRGHKGRSCVDRGYRRPDASSYRTVAVEFHEVVSYCRRCRVELSRKRTDESRIQSLSMPSDMMTKFETVGHVYYQRESPLQASR